MKSTSDEAVLTEMPIATVPQARTTVLRLIPYVLAIFFVLWSVRGATTTDIVTTDASRHAMNGAFIHDLILERQFTSPIAYGKFYYSHLPATSLPFHPPLFPAIESLFFFALGVSPFAARLAVALAMGICVLLFYRLVMATHNSHAIAAASIITFFSFRLSQEISKDVLLEFPALAFTLGALYYLRKLDEGYRLRDGLAFALLAGAAVWTKQHTVFLGLVPFIYVVVSRRWSLLRGHTLWVSSFLFGALVIALTMLSLPFKGTGVDQVGADEHSIFAVILIRLLFYITWMPKWFGLIPSIFVAVAVAFCIFAPRTHKLRANSDDLYLAWAIAALLPLLVLGPYDPRYYVFGCPALVVTGYAVLFRLCALKASPRYTQYILVGVAVLYFSLNINTSQIFLHGPSDAAKYINSFSPKRVLYCGNTNGSFIFALRGIQGQLKTNVIRGDQLPETTFAPEEFEDFAHRYGIEYVVLEHDFFKPKSWNPYWERLRDSPSASMILEHQISLNSSEPEMNGDLRIYRFTNPSANPESTLKLSIRKLKTDTDLSF